MKTRTHHDRQGWFTHAVIGDHRTDRPVVTVEPTGTGGVTLDLSATGGSMDVDVTLAELDEVIRGLIQARTLIKADRRRRDAQQARHRDLADYRAALLNHGVFMDSNGVGHSA